ncbi:MAG TPA: hypothetical protein VJ761_00175 [Ktedonobacteraceae bacterium]|nr:hypothetical protein [Ktedonobacteraceae bacterium]
MPERLAYDEAMQFSTLRLKVQNPELKQGKVELVTIPTSMGTIERPWGIEGGFAVVYKFRRKSGSLCALRCFRVPMSPDTQFRYERIGPYFQTHLHEITAGFKYYDDAISVKDQSNPKGQLYPVIEMDWVDGVTLVDKIHELCGKRDRAALKDLAEQWLRILRTMQNARIAHGDLAGVNVMVRVDGKMVLVDYDGVYIPEFAGFAQMLLGQDDFQHPQMAKRAFHEHMDAFSALVMYIALIALSIKPELWEQYAKIGLDGKLLDVNMLFRQQDFLDPQQSPLFRELEQMGDQRLTTMVQELKRACLQPINDVRFPFTLVDPAYEQKQALTTLESAVQTNDDEQIVNCWIAALEHYAPAQRYRSRVQQAQERVKALQAFRAALATGNIQHILNNYDAAQLDASSSVSAEERMLLSLSRTFLQEWNDDSEEMLTTADALQNTIQGTHILFTAQQQQRLALARQRKNALQAIHAAFASRSIEQIAAAYPSVQNLKGLTHEQRRRAELAIAFMQTYHATDDDAYLAAYNAIQDLLNQGMFVCTQSQEQRAVLIRRHKEAIERFQIALTTRSPWRLAAAYDTILDNSPQVTAIERERLNLARLLTEAFRSGDDDQLVAADAALRQSPHQAFFLLTDEEKQRIAFAKIQKAALLYFRDALKSRKAETIAAAYSPHLDANKQVSQEERGRLAIARSFVQAFDADDDDAFVALNEALQRPVASNFFLIAPQQRERIALAQQRSQALKTFRHALISMPRNAQGIIEAYDASLLEKSPGVTNEEREIVAAAHRFLAMCEALKTAIQTNNDDLIRAVYDPALAQRFSGISPRDQQYIDRAMLIKRLEDLLSNRQYEQALLLAQSIQKTTGQEINDSLTFKLKRAMMRFVREQELTHMTIQIAEHADNNYATISWQWPTTSLIQNAVIVWRTDTWPNRPSEKDQQDPRERQVWVRRKNNVLEDRQIFSIGKGGQIYVRGYAAILDTWDQERVWRFSDGNDSTSYAEAASPQMTWRIQ